MGKNYIFITGPSESGKSGAAKYMSQQHAKIKHIKMRDIIKNMILKDDTSIEFWAEYIDKVNEMTDEKKIVVMDTLRKPKSGILLNELLGESLKILFINASFENRVSREYQKLINKGMKITLSEVEKRTKQKDAEKVQYGLYDIQNVILINNDGSIQELQNKLDNIINMILYNINEKDWER